MSSGDSAVDATLEAGDILTNEENNVITSAVLASCIRVNLCVLTICALMLVGHIKNFR
jgi:hypothetical protein